MVNRLPGTSMFLGHQVKNGIPGAKKMSIDAVMYSKRDTAEQTSYRPESSSANTTAIAASTDETAGDSSRPAEQVAPPPHPAPREMPPLVTFSIWYHGKRVKFGHRPHWLCDHCESPFLKTQHPLFWLITLRRRQIQVRAQERRSTLEVWFTQLG
jgi:hypothetical protein